MGLAGFIQGLSESGFKEINLGKLSKEKRGEMEFDLTAQFEK